MKFFFLNVANQWEHIPTKWAWGTLPIDVVDPRRLLTLELEDQFEEFDSRIRAITDWDPEVTPGFLYPFPIR